MPKKNQPARQTNIQGNITGSTVDGGTINAHNIAGGNIHEHHHYANQDSQQRISNLPPANPHFVGRKAHLQALENTQPGSTSTITQTIAGLGGVGKSQMMLYFAHQQREKNAYDIIWWLRVDEALAEDFLALGRQLGLAVLGLEQAAAVQLVRNWLNGTDKRWLLLCDNADATEPRTLREFLPQNAQGRILITSRNRQWRSLGDVLRLDVFLPVEAENFWQERLGTGDAAARTQLAEELGYLPLAMTHAAAYMQENDLEAAAYLRLYQAQRQELWLDTPPPDDYHATITTTWEIGFAQAKQTPGAADLLNLCCFLAPDDIPLPLLIEHADTVPEELAAVLTDELARNKALRALERYSLLTRSDSMVSLHRLVQTVARDQMNTELAQKWAEAAVDLLATAYNYDPHDMDTWTACGELLPHLRTTTNLAAERGIKTANASNLNNEVGYFIRNRYGSNREAKPFYERALAIREDQLGPHHHDTAQSLNNLGALLKNMGQYEEARPFYERALAIREEQLGPQHPSTATSLNNLGELLRAMGQYEEARPFYERALAIREEQLGPHHPDTGISAGNLASLFEATGNLERALPYRKRALEVHEKSLGKEHPITATSLNNLGALLKTMGQYEEARPFYERALAIREDQLGPHHPDTATSIWWLGVFAEEDGNLAKARELYQRALTIFENALGSDHPNTKSVRQFYNRVA